MIFRQNTSDSIKSIAEALCKAQSSAMDAVADKKNPFYNSKYADLKGVWDACRQGLSENGLAVTQTLSESDGTLVTLTTVLMHNSGEWIRSTLSMKPVKADPQGIGSCITYARRYALAAIVGVSVEDDDGNVASKGDVKQEAKKGPLTKTQIAEIRKNLKEVNDLSAAAGEEEVTEEKMCAAYKIDSLEKMPSDWHGLVIKQLDAKKKKLTTGTKK